MKGNKILIGTVFLSLFLVSIASGIMSLASGVGIASDVQASGEDREEWWDERWHYRMFIEIDPNGYPRRWGNLMGFDAGLDTVSDLDINSIRVVRDGKEIPSYYHSGSDTIELVLDKSMIVGETVPCTVYYDTVANGLKPVENPLAWVNAYLERYYELAGTKYQESEIEQEFEQARDDFIAENSITYDTENDIYTYQGYTVQWNPIDERWEFLDGTIVQFYFIEVDDGMGGYYYRYHDGESLNDVAWHKADGSWWYWNQQTETWVSWSYNGQSIYLGTMFSENVDGELAVGEADLGPEGAIELDLVKYVDDAWATWYDGSQWVTEDILLKAEREVPEAKAFVTTDQTVDISAWGSALFNINGSVQLNDVFLTHLNFNEWLENEFGWITDMTPVGGYMEEIEEELGDDWSDLKDSAERIAIVSEQPAINIDDFDFDVDGYDMTSVYDTGNVNTVSLEVIPVLLDSRYIGLYDVLTHSGFGMVFAEQEMYTNILIEAWKETLDDDSVNYYLNLSVNYLDWWYDSIQDDPDILDLITAIGDIHLSEDGEFNLAMVLLDDIDPSITLQDVLGKIGGTPVLPEEIVTITGYDTPIPIEIGVIFIPYKVEVGQEFEITVGVKGETIGEIKYRVGTDPTEYDFDEVYDFFIINAPYSHWGKRAETVTSIGSVGTYDITVVVHDTNGSTIVKSGKMSVQERAWVIWSWISSTLAGIFGVIGFAAIKRRGSRNCIGGSCNIS